MSEKQKKEQEDETMNFLGNAGGFVPPQKTQNSFGEKEEVVEEKDLEKAIFAHLPFSSLSTQAVLKWGRENAARVCARILYYSKRGRRMELEVIFDPIFSSHLEEEGSRKWKNHSEGRAFFFHFWGEGEKIKVSVHFFPRRIPFLSFFLEGKEYRILSSFFPGRFSRRFEGRPDAAKCVFRSECSKAAKKRRPRPIPPPPTPGGEKLTAQTNPTSIQGSSRIICHFFPPGEGIVLVVAGVGIGIAPDFAPFNE